MGIESMMASLSSSPETEIAPNEGEQESDAPIEAVEEVQEAEAKTVEVEAILEQKTEKEDPAAKQAEITSNLTAALREARAEQKAMRAELEALRAKLDQPKAEAEEEDPDFLADPKAYVDAKEKRLIKALEKDREESTKTKQEVAQERDRQQLLSSTLAAETEFVKTTPDYPAALNHIRSVRSSQLRVIHPEATPEQISGQLAYEEMSFAKQLIGTGKNPAQFAYEYSKAMGYKPAKPAAKNGASRAEARTLGSSGGTSEPGENAESRGKSKDGIDEFAAAKTDAFKRKAKH